MTQSRQVRLVCSRGGHTKRVLRVLTLDQDGEAVEVPGESRASARMKAALSEHMLPSAHMQYRAAYEMRCQECWYPYRYPQWKMTRLISTLFAQNPERRVVKFDLSEASGTRRGA